MNRASRPLSPNETNSLLGSSGLITPIEAGSPTVPEMSDDVPQAHKMSPGVRNKVPGDPTITQPPQPLFKLSMREAEQLVDQFASQVSQQLQNKENRNQHESGCKHCDHCGSSINKQALQLLKQMGLITQSPRTVQP